MSAHDEPRDLADAKPGEDIEPAERALTAREAIYDTEIAPLMDRIIEIARAHNIPTIVHFDLSDVGHEGLRCTTAFGTQAGEMPTEMRIAQKVLLGSVHPIVVSVPVPKGTGGMVS